MIWLKQKHWSYGIHVGSKWTSCRSFVSACCHRFHCQAIESRTTDRTNFSRFVAAVLSHVSTTSATWLRHVLSKVYCRTTAYWITKKCVATGALQDPMCSGFIFEIKLNVFVDHKKKQSSGWHDRWFSSTLFTVHYPRVQLTNAEESEPVVQDLPLSLDVSRSNADSIWFHH